MICIPNIANANVYAPGYGAKELQRSIDISNLKIQKLTNDTESTNIKVEKIWVGDSEHNRPSQITIKLFCDGKYSGKTLTLNEQNDWSGEFDGNFPKYYKDSNGNKIEHKYTVEESKINNYNPIYSYSEEISDIDTSKLQLWVPATEIKSGEDYIALSGNKAGKENLYRADYQTDKTIIGQVNVATNPIKDENGTEYKNYVLINDQDDSASYLTWKAQSVPDAINKFYLYSNALKLWDNSVGALNYSGNTLNVPKGYTKLETQQFYSTEDSNGISNAYKTNSSSGNIYLYRKVNLSKNTLSQNSVVAKIVNRYEPPTVEPGGNVEETISLEVNKKWKNDNEKDRPQYLKLNLLANGKDTGKTLTLTAKDNWSGVFADLSKYDENKKEISYSVKEDVPNGYTVKYDYNFDGIGKSYWIPTNEFVDGETYLIVTKPITGPVIGMEAQNSGKFVWTEKNGAGMVNVSEGPISINGNTYNRYITDDEAMRHTAMQWIADSVGLQHCNQVGNRYCFTLKNVMNGLYAKDTGQGDLVSKPGKESYWYYGYTRVDASGDTAKRKPSNPEEEWSSLLGSANDYFLLSNNHTGDANAVEAQTFYLYKKVTTKNPSVIITNTKSETTSVKVYKVWKDNNNTDKLRPSDINVGLFANGKYLNQKITLNESNKWYGEFANLPKYYDNRKEIKYTVKELDNLDNYNAQYSSGVDDQGNTIFNIVNTLKDETTKLQINKIDSENKRPIEGAEFQISKANSNEILKFVFDKNNNNYIVDLNGDSTLKTSGENCSFLINKLPYGDYILRETKAPSGYLIGKEVYIHLNKFESYYMIGKDGQKNILNKDNQIFNISVENTSAIILPETGGSGFTIQRNISIMVIGISFILMMNLLTSKKRREK